MPALQQRFAKWQIQPMSNTWGCDSSTLDSTEFFLPFIAEQLSEQKPITFCHGMFLDLKKISKKHPLEFAWYLNQKCTYIYKIS